VDRALEAVEGLRDCEDGEDGEVAPGGVGKYPSPLALATPEGELTLPGVLGSGLPVTVPVGLASGDWPGDDSGEYP